MFIYQTRSKCTESTANVQIGSLVLIHEDNVPPMHWVMGRITSAIPGKDQQKSRRRQNQQWSHTKTYPQNCINSCLKQLFRVSRDVGFSYKQKHYFILLYYYLISYLKYYS